MSFGALSGNAVLALNEGARIGNFAHDTGEGGISSYHKQPGGDIIWNIGSGYFGCRDEHGNFSETHFVANATLPQVKMIEIKLSQGAKPGHGGILPGAKVTAEIAQARGVKIGEDCNSPSAHTAFSTPIGLLEFVARLRELSGGKPVGFKLCIGHTWEWFAIAKAMVKTGITPDFIVVDGAEGGTGAAPVEFVDHVGTPLREGLRLVHNTLVGLNLRDKIKIGASGKIVSAFDMARVMALGADWCNSARAFMFAIGCIQAQACHTDKCPTGVTTQDPKRQRALVVADKAPRVAHFHANTLHALGELLAAAGLKHPNSLRTHHIACRISPSQVSLLSSIFPDLHAGSLLAGDLPSRVYQVAWPMADPASFTPAVELGDALSQTHAY
jgi:glutamate synthase domain-containing protein 2